MNCGVTTPYYFFPSAPYEYTFPRHHVFYTAAYNFGFIRLYNLKMCLYGMVCLHNAVVECALGHWPMFKYTSESASKSGLSTIL